MNYEPNLGLYDMRRDTEGLPKSLANRINTNICMKGGGGGGTTVTGGLGPTLDPLVADILTGAISDSKARKAEGPYATVADMTPEQKKALAYQASNAEAKIQGTGNYDMAQANKDNMADLFGVNRQKTAYGGALGSARSMAANRASIGKLGRDQMKDRQAMIDQGVQQLGQAGTTNQKFNQSLKDARFTEDQRTAGLITGTAPKTSTTSGGGGK
jgi:hypothetical protein